MLKVLYESIIGTQTRKRLGEYYTPDWLAEHMVASTVTSPLQQRVLDPACGSGTFLFHTVRRYLTAAAEDGVPLPEALNGLTDHVLGVDLHPVAVALARVTYLLAIGRQRLLDPACGSGTFLFHAVRRYLTAAAEDGVPLPEALNGLTDHVLGVDLHPVAVALARVTYLLAIGRQRLLDPQRGPITVPVYLGDSVQWQQQLDLYTDGHLVVPTGTGGQLFDAELRFP